MTPRELVIMLANLCGGLVFFLYGMSVMSEGLEKMAGGRMEKTLKKVTSKGVLAFFLGAGITVAVQSSSALTVMLVGLVNSGILEFGQTFSVIMGSNVGTTLTSWLLSLSGIDGDGAILTLLKPEVFSLFFALIGIALKMFAKKESKQDVGTILIGFAILITGMELMSNAAATIKDLPGFTDLLTVFSNPILALLVSTVFTGIIQSSAATVGVVQALALTGTITYEMAIPLVLGANIGTCATALISSVGTSTNAKRVVCIHLYFNIIGTIISMFGLYGFIAVNPTLVRSPITIFGVALVHSIFNMTVTLVLMPFKKQIVRLAEITVKEKASEMKKKVFLDVRLMNTPSVAIAECKRLADEMAVIAKESFVGATSLLQNYDEELAQKVFEQEGIVDLYEDKLGSYLVNLSSYDLNEHDTHECGRLLHSIGDFERISDHAVNICESAKEIKDKGIVFSDGAFEELKVMISATAETVNKAFDSFVENNGAEASMVEPLEEVVDELKTQLRARHVGRLQAGKCTIELGFVFADIVTNLERVSDHCSNIAVYTIQRDERKIYTHRYLDRVRHSQDVGFAAELEAFAEKYKLD